MLVDSHVNLHGEAFAEDRDAALERARAVGVGFFLAICDRLQNADAVLAVANAYDDMVCTVGAHPHHAKDRPDLTAGELIDRANDPKIVAFGETGLDLHYGYSAFEDQLASVRAHVEAARATDLPVVFHVREADEPMMAFLREEWERGPFRFLLHSYTSGSELARLGASLGGTFSVNGIATFKNAQAVRDVIQADMPGDRIIIETDCPYLAPVPHRGRRCEPAHLVHVAEKLGDLRGWDIEETSQRTTDAFFALFDKAPRP
ncbi:MAG: TatD family hydrolase [Maricaulaceae bacterium]